MSSSSETPSSIHLGSVDANEALVWVRDGIGDESLPLQRNSSVAGNDRSETTEVDHSLQSSEHPGWIRKEVQNQPDLAPGALMEIAGKGLCRVLSAGTERKIILIEDENGGLFNMKDDSRIKNTL